MELPDAARTLDRDLRALFGSRFRSLVAYRDASGARKAPTPTLAVVDGLTPDDLRACADRVASWHEAGLATPLLLRTQEFGRSLDAFPYEFGAILADHVVVSGDDPFHGLRVDRADLRRACEIQARSHLLHLREGYLETRGRSDALAELISRSLAPFAALLASVARLVGNGDGGANEPAAAVERALGLASGTIARIVNRASEATISSDEARRMFPAYLDAVDRLTHYIDRWTADGR
jgi:hypothetical protein